MDETKRNPLTSEMLAEGKRLLREDPWPLATIWLINNAPALLAAAEENAALRAEVERLKEENQINRSYIPDREWRDKADRDIYFASQRRQQQSTPPATEETDG